MDRIFHISEANYRAFIGDGHTVRFDGVERVLAAQPDLRSGAMPVGVSLEEAGIQLIPESEWDDWIDQHEKNKSDLGHIFTAAPLDQGSTSYCWVHAATHAIEAAMVAAGLPWRRLSPASVGAPIKGYRNVGGWPDEAVQYAAQNGIVPAELWPVNAIDRRYDNDQTREERKKFGPVRYWLNPKTPQEIVTLLLKCIPVPAGLLWWSHAVCYLAVRRLGRERVWFAINSWGVNFGDNGRFTLSWNRGIPDDATAVYFPKLVDLPDIRVAA